MFIYGFSVNFLRFLWFLYFSGLFNCLHFFVVNYFVLLVVVAVILVLADVCLICFVLLLIGLVFAICIPIMLPVLQLLRLNVIFCFL